MSKVLFALAGAAANGVISVTPLLDPADPRNATNAAMKLYKAKVKQYQSDADATDGIVAYGWTAGAAMAEILHRSPKLDRVSVMETARTLDGLKDVGLELPGASWTTSANDWFLGEDFQLIKYDATAQHSDPIGSLTKEDGHTAALSPATLING